MESARGPQACRWCRKAYWQLPLRSLFGLVCGKRRRDDMIGAWASAVRLFALTVHERPATMFGKHAGERSRNMRHFTPAVFVVCIGLILDVVVSARAGAPVPAAIAAATSFHGHLAYQAHPAGDLSIVVDGTLDVNADGWTVDERGTNTHAHASNQQSWIRTGSQTLVFDDPFEVGALANAWA
ncbi:MAG: hypothetical protein M3Z41_05170, partial [Candidatus Eremiobacteraeota bacterium]|nr:hypothetical protein [Candidatus Eremiobacteraeota bacterium]